MSVLTRNFKEVEMGGRSETHWCREMYRENYV